MLTRLKQREDGFAMVTAVAVLAIMSILLVVVLTAGNSAFDISERNARFTRTLAVAGCCPSGRTSTKGSST